jgi:hypothetical protein
MKCDFCSSAKVFRTFQCSSFSMAKETRKTLAIPEIISENAWAACSICTSLIESEDWSELFQRAKAVYTAMYGKLDDGTLTMLREVHKQFRELHTKHEDS